MDRGDSEGVTLCGFGVIFRSLRIVVIRKELKTRLFVARGLIHRGVARSYPKMQL